MSSSAVESDNGVVDMKQLDAMFSSFTRGCNDELYNNFIKVLFEFVDRLIMIFRKYDSLLRSTRDKIALAVGHGSSKEVVHAFMDVADPLKGDILKHDIGALKALGDVELFKGINIAGDWAQISERTQNAIWGYLGKLIVLGAKCLQAEKLLSPLSDDSFRQKLLQTTMECNAEFSKDGKEISSMEDIMAIASKINEKIGMKPAK